MILGMSVFFGNVVIFVSPMEVVVLPPGDQIWLPPSRCPELSVVMLACSSDSTVVANCGMVWPMLMLRCAISSSASIALSFLSRARGLFFSEFLHAVCSSYVTMSGRFAKSCAVSPSLGRYVSRTTCQGPGFVASRSGGMAFPCAPLVIGW